ncbi:hypothetical protein CDL15_Pgr019496 [Punica granatum]|uniref:UspA domain-containing protein n=1 Tax=Punica granatum TaxID=22663 RepID=A0A218VT61_PUNGR|nr:hypothetical protein CDL15_Pgr019496 [Punica granatum]
MVLSNIRRHLIITTPNAPNCPLKLYIVHAKPTASSAVGLAGPGWAADVLPIVDADVKKIAARVLEKAKEIYTSKLHHASILVVGIHGYGAIRRTVLGSVSDYCAHHAHCTMMIVKKPKTKH